MRLHLVALASVVLLTACGGDSTTPEQEVKDVSAEFLQAAIDGRNGEACALTTNPEECLGQLVLAGGFLGEGGFEALLGEDWEEELDAAEVTFSDDDHATIAPLSEDDDPSKLVRDDDEWLVVIDEE